MITKFSIVLALFVVLSYSRPVYSEQYMLVSGNGYGLWHLKDQPYVDLVRINITPKWRMKDGVAGALLCGEATTTQSLFILAPGNKLYKTFPFSEGAKYLPVNENKVTVGLAYDSSKKKAASIEASKSTDGKWILADDFIIIHPYKEDRITVVQDLEFPDLSRLPPAYFNRTDLSPKQMTSKFSAQSEHIKGIPARAWTMVGQSRELTTYARVHNKNAVEFNTINLIYDKINGRSHLFSFKNSAVSKTFRSVVLFREQKKELLPNIGMRIEYTGNYHIYRTGEKYTIPFSIDENWSSLYANSEGVFFYDYDSMSLYRVSISEGSSKTPEKIAYIGTEIQWMFPIPETE